MKLFYDWDKDQFKVEGTEYRPSVPGTHKTAKPDVWTVPATLWHYCQLKDVTKPVVLDGSVAKWVELSHVATENSRLQDAPVAHEHANGLRPYQRVGAIFARLAHRCIIADEQGLGKTPQAIVATDRIGVSRRLIICPSHLKHMWAEHVREWSDRDHNVAILTSKSPSLRRVQLQTMPADNLTLIVGWEQLRLLVEWTGAKAQKVNGGWLLSRTWDALIVDEAHRAGDRHSKQTKVFMAVAQKCDQVVCLTGTPVVTQAANMWPLLHALYPQRYPSYWQFFEAYVQTSPNFFGGVKIEGTKNPELLRAELSPFVIRRLKKDHLTELPDKIEQIIWLDMLPKQEKAYKSMAKEMVAEFPDKKIIAPLKISSYQKCEQIAWGCGLLSDEQLDSNKLDALMEIIEDEAPHKVIVVCNYRKAVERVCERLIKEDIPHARIWGGLDDYDRREQERAFTEDPRYRVLVVSLHAAKEGFTFISKCEGINSSLMVFTGLPDTPKDYDQMCDRLHRLGQKEVVRVQVLLSKGTVEEDAVRNLGLRGAMVRELFPRSGDRRDELRR